MFIVCKACDGSGEGVYGHSWTTCPVCNGAGQVVMNLEPVPYFEPPKESVKATAKIELRACQQAKPPIRVGRNAPANVFSDTDPTGVFPDPMKRRRAVAAA